MVDVKGAEAALGPPGMLRSAVCVSTVKSCPCLLHLYCVCLLHVKHTHDKNVALYVDAIPWQTIYARGTVVDASLVFDPPVHHSMLFPQQFNSQRDSQPLILHLRSIILTTTSRQ